MTLEHLIKLKRTSLAHWPGCCRTCRRGWWLAATVRQKIPLFLKILKFYKNEDLKEMNNFHTCHKVQKWTEDGQFFPQSRRCLKLPGVDSSSTVDQRGQGWLGFAHGMMGYKTQVVASAITLPICLKIEKSGRTRF
ncbi:hypothetical protein ACFX13_013576 [Malus domestica]